jgi:hypothetical protein
MGVAVPDDGGMFLSSLMVSTNRIPEENSVIDAEAIDADASR